MEILAIKRNILEENIWYILSDNCIGLEASLLIHCSLEKVQNNSLKNMCFPMLSVKY